VSFRFWRDGLQPLLSAVEVALARWSLEGEDVDASVSVGDADDDAAYSAAWRSWAGREAELYAACAQKVEPLGWSEVAAIGGQEVASRVAALKRAHAELAAAQLPARLRARRGKVVEHDGATVRLVTYSSYDPIDVPEALHDALPRFDGRPAAQVVARLEAEGVAAPPELLQRLVDWGLLVPEEEG
jgi:hypothetical protein